MEIHSLWTGTLCALTLHSWTRKGELYEAKCCSLLCIKYRLSLLRFWRNLDNWSQSHYNTAEILIILLNRNMNSKFWEFCPKKVFYGEAATMIKNEVLVPFLLLVLLITWKLLLLLLWLSSLSSQLSTAPLNRLSTSAVVPMISVVSWKKSLKRLGSGALLKIMILFKRR